MSTSYKHRIPYTTNPLTKLLSTQQADWFVPEHARIEDSDPRSIIAAPLPTPLSNLRLIHPLRDPETGTFQDTIVERITVVHGGWDPATKEYRRGRRYVPGLRQQIAWPKVEDKKEDVPNDDDTYRINVDEVTDRPYLLQPPMPPSVIDELRNSTLR